jgi:pyruvate dehydrogenase E2 component (dihydrolipoamide acetyltransferase)
MSEKQIPVPDLGDIESVEVIEVCVSPGDTITVDDPLVVLESDKATMEVPSPEAGEIVQLMVNVGDRVSEGDALVMLAPVSSEKPGVTDTEEPPLTENNEPAAPAASEELQVTVPDIGSDKAEVIEILVAKGETVSEETPMLVMESDKASMELPCPYDGVVEDVLVSVGQQLGEGDVVFLLSGVLPVSSPDVPSTEKIPEAGHASVPNKPDSAKAVVPPSRGSGSTAFSTKKGGVYAGPAVRKLGRELGINLEEVRATGPRGRLQKDDLHSFIREALEKARSGGGIPEVPTVDFSRFGETETTSLDRIALATAANMQRSWLNVPHVTQFDAADMTVMEQKRKKLKQTSGIEKLTPLAFLLKVCAVMLERHPVFRSSLTADGQSLVTKKFIHIGLAVDTPLGLLVPVVRDVDKKNVLELAAEIIDLSEKARTKKLSPAEMQGACFTVSSLGSMGGEGFTPIVNTPEVAILGVSRAQYRPVWNGSSFEPVQMLPLSLSYDHRVINGAAAGRFLSELVQEITEFNLE